MRILVTILVAAILIVVCPCRASSEGPPAILNITTYTSPSGRFALTVDPSQVHGGGKGSYRMVRDGQEVWTKELDFTFWEAVVADDGVAAGFGYTRGLSGWGDKPRARGPGAFVVAILAPDGSTRSVNSFPRTERFQGSPNPAALGCFLDAAHNRFVIRFRDENRDMLAAGESWQTWTLDKGEQGPDLALASPRADDAAWYMGIDARTVPGSGLVLVMWNRYGRNPPGQGTRLSLIDETCREVWHREWTAEFGKVEHFSAWMLGPDELTPREGLQPGQFAYRSLSEQARYTFSASKDADGMWKVTEAGRVPDEFTLKFQSRRGAKVEAPPIKLERKGTISLASGGQEDAAALGVSRFEIDGSGRIGFVSNRKVPFEFILIDPAQPGERTFPLAMAHEDKLAFPEIACVGGDKWILVRGSYDETSKTAAVVLDVGSGQLTPVENFEGPSPKPQDGLSGGGARGFAVLGSYRNPGVSMFDAAGRRTWTAPNVGFAQAITVREDGRIGVLIGIANEVAVLTAEGKIEHTIKLEETIGTKPNYVSGLAPGADGGWILHDFNGRPSVYLLDGAGKVLSSYTPHYPDGREFRIHGGLRLGHDGCVWTSDGAAVLRLDKDGAVDRIIGRKPDAESLSEVRSMCVDVKGQIYALDGRNNWTHVFDSSGKKLKTMKPGPQDFSINDGLGSITVDGEGAVYIRPHTMGGDPLSRPGYLKFNADGSRSGFEKAISDEVVDDWVFRPGSRERLVLGYQRAFMVAAEGKVARTIERRADRKWLDHPRAGAIAADGSFAIIGEPSNWWGGEVASVTFFSPSGEPTRTVELPGFQFARISFDGKNACIVSGETLLVINAGTGSTGQFEIPGGEKRQWWYPHSGPGGEVWLLDAAARTLERYALPA